jgi:hypothetical protein
MSSARAEKKPSMRLIPSRSSDYAAANKENSTSLLLIAAATHHFDAESWRAAEAAIHAIKRRWRQRDTDAVIWARHPDAWTHSLSVRPRAAAGMLGHHGPPPTTMTIAGDHS